MTILCFSILKSIEFSGSSGEESSTGDAAAAKAKSLEMLLLEKNRILQTDNTHMKVASSDLTGRWQHMTLWYSENSCHTHLSLCSTHLCKKLTLCFTKTLCIRSVC